ncbi:DUF692 domain-containing protein [Aquincola tertiaricarbonis]|uniref:DUF692 domain-containing protein n=1 Tax=Aquincola tertiaricarbonis TaxID=391953 RepID=UPI0006152D59|nr:DUF692 domain-containing protein [Aquincola tertiaricarbonis]
MHSTPAPAAGIGWRQPHEAELLQRRPALGFIEVHSENYFAEGGAALAVLARAREAYALSLHGVGLALGSAAGLDAWHLDRLAMLAQRMQPVRVSDHACFARAPQAAGGPVVHGNDLLPLGFNDESLRILCSNVQRVQERLRRPIGVENLAAYLGWADDTLAEPQFFNELARRTGCWLLLDLNNIAVNALNAGLDPLAEGRAWVDALDARQVGEIHLAGYDDSGDIVVDDHGSRVHPPVWQLYAHAVRRLGPVPTLIEWDTDLPALDVLLEEAARADALQRQEAGL